MLLRETQKRMEVKEYFDSLPSMVQNWTKKGNSSTPLVSKVGEVNKTQASSAGTSSPTPVSPTAETRAPKPTKRKWRYDCFFLRR
jgi:hypothetical protein